MEMNLLYNSNFAQNLDYLYSTLNYPTRSFIADDQTKLFQTQSATIVSLEEVSAKRLNWAVWGCSVNWVIVVSSWIVGRFWVLHGFFNRLIRGHRKLAHRCVQLHCGKFLGLPSPLVYRLRGCTGNWVIVVSSCIMGRVWVRHRFSHWLLRGCGGNLVKVVPRNSLPKPIRHNTDPVPRTTCQNGR